MLGNISDSVNTWPIAVRRRRYEHTLEAISKQYTSMLDVVPEDRPLVTSRIKPIAPRDRSVHAPTSNSTRSRSNNQLSHGHYLSSRKGNFALDDPLTLFETALQRHFPSHDGWIVTRNYPFKIFADRYYVDELTFSIPVGEDLDQSTLDQAFGTAPEFSNLALVIEHVSSPGEPVLILDLYDSPAAFGLDHFDDFVKSRNATLLDIMGWQMNDAERGIVITAHGTSWSAASIHRGCKARSPTTKVFTNTPLRNEAEAPGLTWIDWTVSDIRKSHNPIRQRTVFEGVRGIKSSKAFATMACFIENGLPPLDGQSEFDDSIWSQALGPISSGESDDEECMWDSIEDFAPFGGLKINASSAGGWSSSDSDEC